MFGPLPLRRRWAALQYEVLHKAGVKTVTQRLLNGAKMRVPTGDELAQRIACEAAFEAPLREEFLRLAPACEHILDIGAHFGYYTLLAAAAAKGARIYAFEPQPAVLRLLKENVALNHVSSAQVFDCALSSSEGTTEFFVPNAGQHAYGSMRANGRFAVKESIQVQTRTVDGVLASLGHPPIGLIKMDVEGAEKLVFEGATELLRSPRRPAILFEALEENTAPFGYTVFDVLNMLHGFGYTLRQLDYENWLASPQPARA